MCCVMLLGPRVVASPTELERMRARATSVAGAFRNSGMQSVTPLVWFQFANLQGACSVAAACACAVRGLQTAFNFVEIFYHAPPPMSYCII